MTSRTALAIAKVRRFALVRPDLARRMAGTSLRVPDIRADGSWPNLRTEEEFTAGRIDTRRREVRSAAWDNGRKSDFQAALSS
jgi:hypothetical protein